MTDIEELALKTMAVNDLVKASLRRAERLSVNLGKKFKAWRLDHSMTRADAAKRLGISNQFLCNIEHGRNSFSQETIQSVLALVKKD
jgi:DNA-binding XRE family transcriptional regulator